MKDLLLLHGALGSREEFDELQKQLEGGYRTHALSFSGHGRVPSAHHAFTIQNLAHEVLDWMNAHSFNTIDIFGYSMGGYVALWLARFYPNRVGKIMTLGTKLKWDQETAEREIKKLQPEIIEVKVPHFAASLAKQHGEHEWKSLMSKTALMMKDLGHTHLSDQDLIQIAHTTLLCLGDQDNMVSREETEYTQKLLKHAQYHLLNNTPHPIGTVSTALLAKEIRQFFG